MFDLLVNGKLVAVCIEPLVGLFKEALVKHLPPEGSLECRKHQEPKPAGDAPEETKA